MKSALFLRKSVPAVALASCSFALSVETSPAARPGPWLLTGANARQVAAPLGSLRPRVSAGLRQFLFQRDHILGTSFDLEIWAAEYRDACRAEALILQEIGRLSCVLNRHDADSEISRLNRGDLSAIVSPDFHAVIRAYQYWHSFTGGAIAGQTGRLQRRWQLAAKNGMPPSAEEAAALASAGRAGMPRPEEVDGWNCELNFDCLGKGYITQKAVESAYHHLAGVAGIMLNIGGDIFVVGSRAGAAWPIFCADPFCPYDNAPPLTSILHFSGAVVTSAAYERGYRVAGQHYSHILDPRTGWPASGAASATVTAPDSVTANALATAMCVLTPFESLPIVSGLRGVEALIVALDGTQYRTSGFGRMEALADAGAGASQVGGIALAATALPAATEAGHAPAPGAGASSADALAVGQEVAFVAPSTISFVRGDSRMKRSVPVSEFFKVIRIDVATITVADDLGFEATVDRTSIRARTASPANVVSSGTSTIPNGSSSSPNPPLPASTAPQVGGREWPPQYQVALSIELPQPAPSKKKIERPFVALWVEDSSGKPVRTITVWGTEPKYLPELTNWWRFAKGQKKLIGNTTRATRPAGKYQVIWDGLDDDGKPVPRGTYTIALEVSREHGSHQIQRGTIDCGDAKAMATIAGAVEFLDCAVAYGPIGL